MTKALLLLGSSFLLSSSAYAQAGLRVGGTWMDLAKYVFDSRVGEASVKTASQFGYHVGVYYQVPLSKRFSLVPEVQFSHERQRVNVNSSVNPNIGSVSDYNLRASYLNVPVLARLALGPVYLEAGPQASLLLGGRGEGVTLRYDQTGSSTATINQAATARYQRFDAGICVGVGAALPAGLGISLRAYQGLRNVNPGYTYDPTSIPYGASSEHRQLLQASLTYQVAHHL
jgi:hypothetical protein